MRISGTEPSSVILSQICSLKSWKVKTKKCQIQKETSTKMYTPFLIGLN